MTRKTLIVLCVFAAMLALFLLVSCGPPQEQTMPVPDFFVERPLPDGPAVIIPDGTGDMPIVKNGEEKLARP